VLAAVAPSEQHEHWFPGRAEAHGKRHRNRGEASFATFLSGPIAWPPSGVKVEAGEAWHVRAAISTAKNLLLS
jgi:hypothetical protein